MQSPHIKLKEIIWEITPECHNNCSYCGSESERHIKTDEDIICSIADKISKYPPEQIDISGGDPLLVSHATHKYITSQFFNKSVCKILCNPKSFKGSYINTLQLYDWVGISINNEKELNKAIDSNTVELLDKKCTIISNFNSSNIFYFDSIQKFVEKNKLCWQIQYTIFMEKDDDRALYNNDEALQYFKEKLNKAVHRTDIILADNCNSGKCGAGMSSLGILYDGSIVPCLSMRSWNKNIETVIVANILDDNSGGLEYIWKNLFEEYRFKEFICCKDFCNNKEIQIMDTFGRVNTPMLKDIFKDDFNKKLNTIVTVYGVSPNTITVYGVWPSGTMVYSTYNPEEK